MGITGRDIISESEADVSELMTLGFGKCRLCLQAPIGKYKSASELAGKRIVTSFPTLATKFFNEMEEQADAKKTSIKYVYKEVTEMITAAVVVSIVAQNSFLDYSIFIYLINVVHCRYVSGSVEAACRLGLADGIVDLVETGTTMKAAGLEIVHTIMETETVLINNRNTQHPKLVDRIYKRIRGYILAQQNCLITYNVERKNLHLAEKITPGHESPTVMPLEVCVCLCMFALDLYVPVCMYGVCCMLFVHLIFKYLMILVRNIVTCSNVIESSLLLIEMEFQSH
jgi:ATP phosphoribosyltransferase